MNQTINAMLCLFNVLRQIIVVPHEQINSSFLLVIAWNKHEWTSEGILFQSQKDISSIFQVHRCYSALRSGLFLRQKWQTQRYDWSDHLSIKLHAKGQFNEHTMAFCDNIPQE